MAFNINDFKARGLRYGGARPTLFQVEFVAPTALGLSTEAQQQFRYLAQSATLPASQIDQIEVPFFGRKIKIQGDRTYLNWAVNVMNDEDFLARDMFEKWHNAQNAIVENVRSRALVTENSYKCDVRVTQFSKTGDPLRTYVLVGAWPVNVGQIQLSWNATNQVETFEVQWAFDYFTVENARSRRNPLGAIVDAVRGAL